MSEYPLVSGLSLTITPETAKWRCPIHGDTNEAMFWDAWDPDLRLCQRCWWDHLKTVCQKLEKIEPEAK